MNALQTCFTAAALLAGAAALHPASAAPLTFSSGGVFNTSAPASAFSAPGASWSVSFVVDANPAPLSLTGAVLPGSFTTVPFTSFSYQLHGVTVAPAMYVTLYASSSEGGIDLVFGGAFDGTPVPFNALSLYGPQLYAGPETSPTLLPGTYTTFRDGGYDGVQVAFEGVLYGQGNTVMSMVPAPPAGLTLLAGLALFGAVRRWAPASTLQSCA